MTRHGSADDQPWGDDIRGVELERLRSRRHAMQLPEELPDCSHAIGLALSGGGIRSATLSLGVLQELARSKVLPAIDYLSTVSGGGYIGAFFMSLFARAPQAAPADDPYALLAGSSSRPPEPAGGRPPTATGRALWWLRNSGRYLAPTGAGDYIYAIAMQIRNWIGLHLVLGIAILTGAGPVVLLDAGLRALPEALSAGATTPEAGFGLASVAVALLAGWTVPAGFAFFACEMPKADASIEHGSWWKSRTTAVFLATAAVLGLGAVALRPASAATVSSWMSASPFAPALSGLPPYVGSSVLSYTFAGFAAVLVLSVAYLAAVAMAVDGRRQRAADAAAPDKVSAQGLMQSTRVNLTKNLAASMKWVLGAAAAAIAVGTSHHIVADWDALWRPLAKTGSGAGVVLIIVRQVAAVAAQPAKSSVLRRIPLDVAALVIGLALFSMIAIAWFCLAWAIVQLAAGMPLRAATRLGDCLPSLTTETLLMGLVGFAVARSFQFINMSTLQSLYASRLTRAYLGASNFERIADADPRWTRISDPHPADDLTLERYYRKSNGAPVHLINVTLNETVSPTDPLVQRDRHGRPMTITPDHYVVDGMFRERDVPAAQASAQTAPASAKTSGSPGPAKASGRPPKLPEQLSLGQWISISGAAFSTGVGRQTSLGKSLALGLANVRLGYWWRAGPLVQRPAHQGIVDTAARLVARAFETQSYLFAELLARFAGRYARYWYLSDGGHFENTGLYELLRRRVGVVIACDNGADPQYSSEDLANAMRLSRIDLGIEFFEFTPRMLRPIPVLAPLARALMTIDTPGRGGYLDDACLRVLWAYPADASPDNAAEFIVAGTLVLMIKPRLVRAAPTDVRQYARTHPAFPQETTADQFFTEEQWESYRKLGQTSAAILARVFEGAAATPVEALGRLASIRQALGHVASTLLVDPRAAIMPTQGLDDAMADAAAAAMASNGATPSATLATTTPTPHAGSPAAPAGAVQAV